MIIIAKLLLAHFIGDFILQPSKWIKSKEISKVKSKELYLHILIHGLLVLILLWNWDYWYVVLLVVSQHLIIDLVKLCFQKTGNKYKWFFYDQGMHIVSIITIWYLCFNPDTLSLIELFSNLRFWIYSTAIIFITKVSGFLIQNLMWNWTEVLNKNRDESLQNAGKYIGILERLLVFLFIVTSHWEAIGFLLAAKSVFRFGDLKESKDRKLTEYILIGTLISFGIAIVAGLIVLEVTA
jgi:hypothetical protein